ncbi:MAG TPA: hypothetical protein VHX12_01890 [Acidisoma sp.]|jgi:hypothetical protein|nr:hypothetical protein [Acidisoma sp.]
MAMTPSIALPSSTAVDEYRAKGSTFGREWRGRPRRKFEETLVKRLDALGEEVAGLPLDAEEAIAAFDVAAWDAWEAGVSGTSLAGSNGTGLPAKTGRGQKPQPGPTS